MTISVQNYATFSGPAQCFFDFFTLFQSSSYQYMQIEVINIPLKAYNAPELNAQSELVIALFWKKLVIKTCHGKF